MEPYPGAIYSTTGYATKTGTAAKPEPQKLSFVRKVSQSVRPLAESVWVSYSAQRLGYSRLNRHWFSVD